MEAAAKTPQSNAPDSKLHFLDYWRIIRIRKAVILTVFLLVVMTTTAVTLMLKPSYASTVRLAVDKDTSDIAPLGGAQAPTSYDPYFIQTEFERIQSRSVLYDVIDQLQLNERFAKDLELAKPFKTSESYNYLLRLCDVRQSRNTSLIEIRVFNHDPKLASDIANKIAEVYRDNRLKNRKNLSSGGIEALKKRFNEQSLLVQKKQDELHKERELNKISDAVSEGSAGGYTLEPATVARMESERNSAQAAFISSKTLRDELIVKRDAKQHEALSVAYPDPLLTSLLEKRLESEFALIGMNPDLGAKNPALVKAQQILQGINKEIVLRVEFLIEGLTSRTKALKANADALDLAVTTAKEKEVEAGKAYRRYFQLKRDLDSLQRVKEALNLRIMQEGIDQDIPKQSIVEITDYAEPAQRPERPKIPLNIALGVIVGLVLGVGLAFFIEYLDTSVKTIDDVERAVQAPVLAVIPQNVGSLLLEGPDSPHAEAYRVLRTNVLFSRKNESLTTLTVVSGGAGEGKSTTIFNLAIVFAQNGQRVLIVDSDLRRPSLHKILNVTNSIGLTNYLLRQNTLEQVIQTTKLPGLDFLPSGKLPSSSMGILNSTRMKEFIQDAKGRYDFVFFDSPPIMGVSDASILASEVDLALLVIQYRKYPQAMTVRAKQMVEKVGGRLLGVVLNNINISQDSYYYYYSGYYYDYYSKHDDGDGDSKKNGEKKKKSPAPPDRASADIKPKY